MAIGLRRATIRTRRWLTAVDSSLLRRAVTARTPLVHNEGDEI